MRERLKIFAAFGTSLCGVCAFLAAALLLGSLNGCGNTAVTQPPVSFLEPSGQPTADPTLEPQLSADPAPIQSDQTSETVALPPAQSNPVPVTQPSVQPSQSSSENGFQAILRGNAAFFSTDAAQSLTINELSRVVSDDSGITAKALKYAIVDLDGNGVSEVVLWLKVNENDSFGFEVLRQQSGQIYGYTLPYRSFMDLKRDGTFSFSSGFGTLSFSDKAYTINETTYSQSAYNSNNELTVSYFVNGQAASEAEYLAAVGKQNGKESVSWYDFTDENIASGIGL